MDADWLSSQLAAGRSIESIAREAGRSSSTVAYWVNKHGLVSTHAAKHAARGGIGLECPVHGPTRHVRRRDGGLRCLACRSDAVSARRRRVKALLVEEAGGCCVLCGYAESHGALHFHHVDAASKSFALGYSGVTRSLAKARAEAAKCVLSVRDAMPRSNSASSGYPFGR